VRALPVYSLQEGTQPAPSPPGGGFLGSPLVLLGLLFAILYFLVLRPERKRAKARAALIAAVRKNDHVVTTGGIHGTVVGLRETEVLLRVDENVRIRVNREAIAAVLPREEEGGSEEEKS
jgi:preprotein translocase subunit YajC